MKNRNYHTIIVSFILFSLITLIGACASSTTPTPTKSVAAQTSEEVRTLTPTTQTSSIETGYSLGTPEEIEYASWYEDIVIKTYESHEKFDAAIELARKNKDDFNAKTKVSLAAMSFSEYYNEAIQKTPPPSATEVHKSLLFALGEYNATWKEMIRQDKEPDGAVIFAHLDKGKELLSEASQVLDKWKRSHPRAQLDATITPTKTVESPPLGSGQSSRTPFETQYVKWYEDIVLRTTTAQEGFIEALKQLDKNPNDEDSKITAQLAIFSFSKYYDEAVQKTPPASAIKVHKSLLLALEEYNAAWKEMSRQDREPDGAVFGAHLEKGKELLADAVRVFADWKKSSDFATIEPTPLPMAGAEGTPTESNKSSLTSDEEKYSEWYTNIVLKVATARKEFNTTIEQLRKNPDSTDARARIALRLFDLHDYYDEAVQTKIPESAKDVHQSLIRALAKYNAAWEELGTKGTPDWALFFDHLENGDVLLSDSVAIFEKWKTR